MSTTSSFPGRSCEELIVDGMDDAALVIDEEWELVYANRSALEYAETTCSKLQGRAVLELADELVTAGRDRLETTLDELFEGNIEKRTIELEFAFETSVVGECTISPVREDGAVVGATLISRDITELQERETALEKERAFLRSTIDALPDLFYAYDDEGELIFYNDEMETATGYSPAELEETDPWELVPDEDSETIAEAFWTVIESGEPEQVEGRLLTEHGETIPYEFTGGPLRGPDGSVDGLVGIGRDITGRVEYERQLAELHHTTQRLMQATDVETVAELVCEGAQEILGLAEAGLVVDHERGVVPVSVTDGLTDIFGGNLDVLPPGNLAERVLERGEEIIVEDVTELDLPEVEESSPRALVAMPLGEGAVFGALDSGRGPVNQQTIELARILSEQATEALKRIERERELRIKTRAIESAPVGISISDPNQDDNTLMYVNEQFCEMTGYSKREALGHNCRFLQGEETSPETVARMREAIDNRNEVAAELRNYRKDGTPFWNNLEIAPVEEDGEVTHFVGFQQDVTERRQREAERRETKRQFEAVLDTISAAVFMKDTEGRYLLMNRECREILGVGQDVAVEGISDEELFPPEVAAAFRKDDAELFEREEALEIEEVVPTVEGHKTHLTRKSPVYDEDGNLYALCAVSTDVSELKQRERELEQFAYAASHDLREPLRVISNYLQLLERRHADQLDDSAREYVDFAVDAATRMKALIDGLLTYSRIDRRGAEFQPTDLNEALDDAMENLRIAIEQSEASIERVELPTVDGDRNQLVTVFQNLLDNAITYAGEKPPAIEITVEEGNGAWILTVEDRGVGMDPEQTDRALEMFERLHSEDTAGTGMGLALCEKIIGRHGGNIWIDSELGKGTAVQFTLPKTNM